MQNQRYKRGKVALLYWMALVIPALAYWIGTGSGEASGSPIEGKLKELFFFLSGLQLLLIGVTVPRLTVRWQGKSPVLFMLQIVGSTFPVLAVTALFGSLPLSTAAYTTLFSLYVVLWLSIAGAFFSRGKNLMAAYAVAFFLYVMTGLMAGALASTFPTAGYLLGLNPMGALLSLLNPEFSRSVLPGETGLQLWHVFALVYTVAACLMLPRTLRTDRRGISADSHW